MTQLADLARPVVAPTARLHRDQTRRQVREIRQHLLTAEFFLDSWKAGSIDTKDMKTILAQVHSNSI